MFSFDPLDLRAGVWSVSSRVECLNRGTDEASRMPCDAMHAIDRRIYPMIDLRYWRRWRQPIPRLRSAALIDINLGSTTNLKLVLCYQKTRNIG